MKNTLLRTFTVIYFITFSSMAQVENVVTVNYANILIPVPENYRTTSEYEIKNEDFSAQWIYLTKEIFAQNLQVQLIEQIASQVPVEEIGPIEFISSEGKFLGTKYQFKNSDGPKKYVVFACGIVNDQPLVLILHFKNEPLNNANFDELTRKFIKFKE